MQQDEGLDDQPNATPSSIAYDFEDFKKVDKHMSGCMGGLHLMAWVIPMTLLLLKKGIIKRSELQAAVAYTQLKLGEGQQKRIIVPKVQVDSPEKKIVLK